MTKKTQKEKNDETVIDLRRFIKAGVVRNERSHKIVGIWFLLPVKPVSINEYTKFHFSQIAKYRKRYKSILDVGVSSLFKHENFGIDGDGIHFKEQVFQKVELSWVLTFSLHRLRDISNYIQKILLDALTDTGIVKDDNYTIVTKDSVMISPEKAEDAVLLYMVGEFDHTRLQEGVSKNGTKYTRI